MAGKLEPCGSWQVAHSPDLKGSCTTFFFAAAAVFLWQEAQSSAPSIASRFFFLPACGLWHEAQPAPVVTALCGTPTGWAMPLWQAVQSAFPAAKVSLGPLAACGSWQATHCPFLKGVCSNLLPPVSLAASWQFA